MLLPVCVYLILLFNLIAVPLSLLLHFYFVMWRTRCLCLPIWIACTAYMVAFLTLRVLYMAVLCLFRFCLSFVSWFSLLNPFLATMSFGGYFDTRFFLYAFFPVCLFCFILLRPCSFPVCFGVTSSIL